MFNLQSILSYQSTILKLYGKLVQCSTHLDKAVSFAFLFQCFSMKYSDTVNCDLGIKSHLSLNLPIKVYRNYSMAK